MFIGLLSIMLVAIVGFLLVAELMLVRVSPNFIGFIGILCFVILIFVFWFAGATINNI